MAHSYERMPSSLSGSGRQLDKPLRLLCLHSFRTSAAIFKQQFQRSGLDTQLEDLVQLDFIDAPLGATGPAPPDVQAFFQPPYYEWCSAKQDDDGLSWKYEGVPEAQAYVIDYLNTHGPYDGIVGFSQGALLGSALVAMKHAAFPEVQAMPDLRLCIFIGAAKSRHGRHLEAFEATQGKVACRSLHLIGDKDQYRPMAVELVECFRDPVVVMHRRGHVVPQLPEESLQQVRGFLSSFGPSACL